MSSLISLHRHQAKTPVGHIAAQWGPPPPLPSFLPRTQAWFSQALGSPTPVQRYGWHSIAQGHHSLMLAPTGSGKTLAAFLWALDRLAQTPKALRKKGYGVVYLSPLKALAEDVARNLQEPLAQMGDASAQDPLRIHVRTGDTKSALRQKEARQASDLLVTTPESLFLLLAGPSAHWLKNVHTLIVDEVHALVANKRGAHLSLSLERLDAMQVGRPPVRIGLSATLRNPSEAARFLAGSAPVAVIDASQPPDLSLAVDMPLEIDMAASHKQATHTPGPIAQAVAYRPAPKGKPPLGIWSSLYPKLSDEIARNRSTLIFVNSRGLCERLCHKLNEAAGKKVAWAHHGSISLQERQRLEAALKAGELPAVVATSSLELGIDMGAIDKVILIESPGSVARGLQRAGRAGHAVGATSHAVLYPTHNADLLEGSVVAQGMRKGAIETLWARTNALDVLAQQLCAAVCAEAEQAIHPHPGTSPQTLWAFVTRAHGYTQLPVALFDAVLTMLTGGYPSADLSDLQPLLQWNPQRTSLYPRPRTPLLCRLNAGTIPQRGVYPVVQSQGRKKLGDLDEELVFESQPGDVVILGASTWRIDAITPQQVQVSTAPGEPGRLPFWHGQKPSRPTSVAQAMSDLLMHLDRMASHESDAFFTETMGLSSHASARLGRYIDRQKAAPAGLPHRRRIALERSQDAVGDWQICVLSPWGKAIHMPWAFAIQAELQKRDISVANITTTDDGMVLRLPKTQTPPPWDAFFPDPKTLHASLAQTLPHTPLFASMFRQIASTALLLPKRAPGMRTPLWLQRQRAHNVLDVAASHPDFPMIIETQRTCLQDVFDLPGLLRILNEIEHGSIEVHTTEAAASSPFSRSLIWAYVAEYLYNQDEPMAAPQNRAQALSLNSEMLEQLLGAPHLRPLLHAPAMVRIQDTLQRRLPHQAAESPQALLAAIQSLGERSDGEIDALCTIQAPKNQIHPWLHALQAQGQVAQVYLGGIRYWIASQEMPLYARLDAQHPGQGSDPLPEIARRYARTHGPFQLAALADRLDVPEHRLADIAGQQTAKKQWLCGEFWPGQEGLEYCHKDVLERIRIHSRKAAQKQLKPQSLATFTLYLSLWQKVLGQETLSLSDKAVPEDKPSLEDVLTILEAWPMDFSLAYHEILPRRLGEVSAGMLDAAGAQGVLAWQAVAKKEDGAHLRIQLLHPSRLEMAASVLASGLDASSLHAQVLQAVHSLGAPFLAQIAGHIEKTSPSPTQHTLREIQEALAYHIRCGAISNDTFTPWCRLGSGVSTPSQARPKRMRNRRSQPRSQPNKAQPSRKIGEKPWEPRTAALAASASHLELATSGGRFWAVHPPSEQSDKPHSCIQNLALSRAKVLLGRYGIVWRQAAAAQGWAYPPIYQALLAMERAGKVQRGFFVADAAGLQFALPKAIRTLQQVAGQNEERAIDSQPSTVQVLAAQDPANPLGTLFAWPNTGSKRPQRHAKSWIVTIHGHAIFYLFDQSRKLIVFAPPLDPSSSHQAAIWPKAWLEAACSALAKPHPLRPVPHVAEINGQPWHTSPYKEMLAYLTRG